MVEDNALAEFKRLYRLSIERGHFHGALPIPGSLSSERLFTDSGSRLSFTITNQSFALLQSIIPILQSLPHIDDGLETLVQAGLLVRPRLSNDQGQPTDDPAVVKRQLITQLLNRFSKGVDKYGHFSLSDEELCELFADIKRHLDPSIRYRTITVPLINFTMGESPVHIDGVELSAFTGEEKTALWRTGSLDYSVGVEDFSRMGFRLSARYGVTDQEATFRINNVIYCFIDTLRLLKEGEVGALWSFDHGDDTFASFREFSSAELTDYYARPYRDTYSFLDCDLAPFQSLFQAIRSLRQSGTLKPLEIGLRRFNQAYGRLTEEDKIIDWTIALESTLLANLSDELRYRTGVRGAALLYKHREPSQVRDFLLCLYDIRSMIVHRGMTFLDQRILKKVEQYFPALQFMTECQNLLRQILCEYIVRLQQGKTIQMINEDLEAQIIIGLNRQESSDQCK